MCGLIGMFSVKDNGFTNEQAKILEESLIFNQLRGDDSTGAACITNKDAWSFIKAVGGYKSLTRHYNFNNFRNTVLNHGRLVFGHGRAATRGLVSIENAHPFHIKRKDQEIIFVHNGTLDNSQSFPGFYSYSVDSEFLGAMIAEHGAEKALSEVNGAIACMWWDVTDNTFNFYHNADRPLNFMITKSGEFFLNSEKWLLNYINWKFKLGVSEKSIYGIEEMAWHKLSINGDNAGKYYITRIKRPKIVKAKNWASIYSNGYEDDSCGIVYRPAYHNNHLISVPTILPEDKEFWNREIDIIEWINGNKIVKYRNGTVETCKEEPPEKGLLRMYEIKGTGNVMKAYQSEANAAPLYVEKKFAEWLEEKKRALLRTPERTKKDDTTTIIRFTTRHPKTKSKVKHYGEVLKGSDKPHLQLYRNNIEGEIKIGQKMTVEVLYCEDKLLKNAGDKPMVKVICSEMTPNQGQTYVDYVFYTSLTKEQVDRARIFQGLIGSITLSTVEEQHVSGAVAICSLYNVEIAGEEKNEEVAVSTLH